MAWSDIELHVGGEDTGTSGFGAATSKGQSVSGGYQVEKLATITAGSKVSSRPVVSSCSTKQCMCLAIDSSVYVIDHVRRDGVFDLSLDKTVDCVAMSPDSSFLVVGNRTGQLHFLDIELQKVIFTEVLVSSDNIQPGQPCLHSATFWATSDEPGFSLVVTTSAGTIYFFSRIALNELHEAIVDGDNAAAQEVRSKISLKVFSVAELHNDWIGQVLPIRSHGMPAFLITGKGRCGLSIWGLPSPMATSGGSDSGVVLIDAVSRPLASLGGIRRAQLTQDGTCILLLSEAGKLSMWNAKCLVLLAHLVIDDCTDVLDFQLASGVGKTWRKPSKGSVGHDEPHLVMLLKTKSKYMLEIRSFPSFETVYQKVVTGSAHLSMPPNSLERLFVVNDLGEFVSSSTSSLPIPAKLCVHCFSEAIPEKRLASLLRKGQFDQAQLYAEQFGLDVQAVHEARCSWLLQSPGWDVEAHQLELLAKLTMAMDAIQDTDYVAQCCLDDPPPCRMATAAMLKYADKRLSARLAARPPQAELDALTAQRDELEATTIRFGTYQLAYGGAAFSPSHWQSFRSSTIVSEIYQCLLGKRVSAATIMWQRHKSEVHRHISLPSLQQLLNAVPDSLSSKSLVGFLRDALLPSFVEALHRNINAEVLLNKWVRERALRLELSEKSSWPGNALTLVATVTNTLHSPHSGHGSAQRPSPGIAALCTPATFVKRVTSLSANSSTSSASSASASDSDSQLLVDGRDESLQPLLQQLTDLHLLHTRYRCPLTLQQYSLESKRTIGFRLLERVAAVEVIEQALTQQIVPYCQQNMLNSDQILLDYIKDFIANHGHLWRNYASSAMAPGSSAPWEAKLLAIVPHIKKMELRLGAVFELFRVAALPWSSAMDALVQQALTWEHSRHEELQQQIRTAQLCSMLRRYGIRHISLKQSALARDMLRHIVHSEEATCMQDALELVSVFHHLKAREAYVCRMQFLCYNDKLGDIGQLLKSLDAETATQVAYKFLEWCEAILDSFQFDEPSPEVVAMYDKSFKQVVCAACECLDALLCLQEQGKPPLLSEQEQERWRNISRLLEEFSVRAKPSDFTDVASREVLLAAWLSSESSTLATVSAAEGNCPGMQRVERLGHLLQLPGETLLLWCVERCLESEQLDSTVHLCRLVLDRDAGLSLATSSRLYRALHSLQQKVLLMYQAASPATAFGASQSSTVAEASKLAEECLSLTSVFATMCAKYGLQDALPLAKSSCRLYDLTKACSSSAGGLFSASSDWQWSAGSSRTFSKLVTGDTFEEDTLVLSPGDVFPLLETFSKTVSRSTGSSIRPCEYQQLCFRSFQPRPPVAEVDGHGEVALFTAGPGDLMTLGTVTHQMTSVLLANGSCQQAVCFAQEALFQFLQFFAINYSDSGKDEAVKESLEDLIHAVLKKATQVIVRLWENLLSKVLAYQTLDLPLILGCMLRLPMNTVFTALNQNRLKCHGDHRRLQALSWLGIQYLMFSAESGNQSAVISTALQECTKLYDLAGWGVQLAAHKISLSDDFHKNRSEQKEVLQLLLSRQSVTLELLLDFCRYFDFNREKLLQLRMQGYLLPKSEESSDDFSGEKSQIPADSQPAAELPSAEVLVAIVHQAAVQKDMLQVIFESLQKMDPYDYDRIACALSVLKTLWPSMEQPDRCILQGPQLLDILYHYQRHSPPGEAEVEFVTSPAGDEVQFLQPVKKMPDWSNRRLPFHMLLFGNKAMKVLTSEVNAETLPTLVPLAMLLKLPTDQLHMTAVQNSTTTYLASKKRSSSPGLALGQSPTAASPAAGLSPTHGHGSLFSSVQPVLLAIQDPRNAIATAAWIHSKLEKGSEKLAALKGCLHLSKRWAATTSDMDGGNKAAKSMAKFKLLHDQLAVDLLLQQRTPYTAAEIDGLSKLPVDQIISQLYQHGSIAWNAHGQVSADFDIHAVADEIAVIYDIDVDNVRLQLVKKWLPTAASRQEQTSSLWTQPSVNFAEEEQEDEVNLQRVIYLLLHHDCSEKGALYLLQYAYKETASKITNTCKARAMRVLFAIVRDVATLERISQLKLEELWAYLYSLVCVAELDRLHISQSLASFQQCNKDGLVKGLLKNHRTSPQALRFAVGFSLDQQLYDIALWGDILQQMLNLGMLPDLQQSLVSASHVPQLLKIPHLLQLWQAVLVQPLLDVRTPVSGQAKVTCSNVLQQLTMCPLIVDIDTAGLANHFLRLELPAQALCCALVGSAHTSVLVQGIVERTGAEDLLAECQTLAENSVSLAHQAISYLEAAIQEQEEANG